MPVLDDFALFDGVDIDSNKIDGLALAFVFFKISREISCKLKLNDHFVIRNKHLFDVGF